MHIRAATSNDGSATGAARVAMMDGTSMATAHLTGSGALLAGLHPDWTPLEIKSALMMTAKESGLTKADGTTASDYFDRGAGRVQEFLAGGQARSRRNRGSLANADPWIGGDPVR
jgi:subtilisin family serine protease